MVLKPDQERVKKMIKETLTLLCKNGLAFDLHFSIEALIGVTLDDKDVFLVNINELVKSDKVPEADGSSEEQSVGASGEEASEEEYNGSGQLTPGTGHRRKRHKRRGIKREPNRGDSSNEEEPASKMSNDRRDPDRARVKKEANNDSGSDSNVIVIKEELDDCWNESGTPDNASFGQYMNMPSTSQDQNFTSLSDMSLLPIGSQDSGQVWSQAAAYASGGSMGRGLSRSSTSTSTSQLDPSQEAALDIDTYKDVAHYPSRLPPTEKKLQPRRRCRVCYKKGIRRDSNYMCVLCPEQPSLCLTPCFRDYHVAKMCPVAVLPADDRVMFCQSDVTAESSAYHQ
ncbi:hypothetical protein LSH36_63g05030 [Paralvinella palmiformis]|uniref:PiggyBac transposable element-derived protein 4 C-terminal zinc-finger domain-containing protein n=1 Tax=Paralvinella palmiformis TaxID=53620 RepID=A0AAD9K3W6_9ANNE|nr:hypothetical protein LSH36_63g05030 [Paralvinella palmiformis]